MPLNDPEYLPLSYLSQTGYCPRRVGLLLNERIWVENADTAKGRKEHESVHTQRIERRGSQVKLFEYAVFSDTLGICGKCDLIEAQADPSGCRIPPVDFPVRLYPVEYKHGKLRDEQEYKMQLCAQAMCLEEMYRTAIPEGAIFYLSSHRRQTVLLDEPLRRLVRETAKELHRIRETLSVPSADYSQKCRRCSLLEYCLPGVRQSARAYCEQLAQEAKEMETI
ncbi:CRISPR-associated protein Cas4 [Pseudoflavonifractor phocaeensis]|uniref:CRISPR-associated protein Cas4 n=1 Tax=Pseudoflavonifractor phocaeensis TaxID=1870988 RepID=UPI00195D0F62|nr:CRISPR-associated protein Cas4 [Pseudoflavonifractor phocaeensis]MBM6870137.1 CRISPR-associated protein Cas4 [Pseudoflavonifractor phocaeensis]MBM6939043.1 CRISPR-associated protein Cas4 [Pseudoflavonifractor phocaeensis]